jgi:MFS family permease
MGAGAVTTSLLMVLNIAATTAANLCATLIPDRGDRRLLLYGTFALFAGGALMAALAGSTALLFASNALMGVAGGLSFPILVGLSIRHVDAAHRTTAMGIHQSVYSVGLFAGPWLGGVVADAVGIPVMFAIAAAFSLVAPSALISLYRDRRTMPAPA